MSALARYFHSRGILVSGYDKTPTALTNQLEAEGIAIHFNEDINIIPKDVDLVVYTPAVPKEHKELAFYQQNNYTLLKRSEVLGALTNSSFNICVAGTHGKTTVSTMIAHILRSSGYGCNAFLGGIAVNYQTNFWSSENDVCVIEADEYDRSFLQLNPDIALITSMDADHLDIYGDEASMQDAFVAFGDKVKEQGLLFSKFGLKRTKEIKVARKKTYSLQNESANAFAGNIKIQDGGYVFDAHLEDKLIPAIEMSIGGMHNVENAIAAIAVANELKIDPLKIAEAIAGFKGVRRRFEYSIPPVKKQEGAYVKPVLIDDYAHHPAELKALLTSVKSLFPQRVVTVIFQPHLFTRTRDFANGFAEALSIADNVVLLPIYPARELPIPGVSSEMVLEKINANEKVLVTKEGLLDWMREHVQHLNKEFGEVIVMAGAGDIDAMVMPVKNIIEELS
ncbi:UDP-N-acetylmuramate--L-alanine ligase [Flavisolibacter ginsengisoli DSM 18119]|jgi:UDP-N-acetylmuramate--alanine ligase|uniref:UDP-N-acetylmuramate--L-alanine ligase n=2 Tax=Flavisolibacter TaxID=398041 RepID=A0A1M5CT48_9BACT|nr:UDP-N-acetylmuramate--L-alanine ligase [Flavisolibacter ginsengisoli DSM 18119]